MNRKLLIAVIMFFSCLTLRSQTTTVYTENFEVADSVSSSGTPSWSSNNTYQHSGSWSYHNTVVTNDTSWLTTTAFSTVGNTFVILEFSHICKIEFFDYGTVEVSSDNGANWTKLTDTEYQGTSNFPSQGDKFSGGAYIDWDPANPATMPTNSWWKDERFDISALVSNSSQVKVRFKLYDGNGTGSSGAYGWLIDDIKVTAAPSELYAPVITMVPPIYSGSVYSLGPFDITADITDGSGISTASLIYTVNGGGPSIVSMTNTTGSTYVGTIPAATSGDSICYYVEAVDASSNGNVAYEPTTGCTWFKALSGITFPYVENFDGANNNWTATNIGTGSSWELGTPNFGATNSAYSAPNAWDIDLITGYKDNSEATLTSPIFDFSTAANAKLSFWQNRNTDASDGVRLEYTTDGTTWQILGTVGDPNAVNWYTLIHWSGNHIWEGNSGGWIQSEYILSVLNYTTGPVQFRFIFQSDFFLNEDGFSIDDFSIILPSPLDAGVTTINQPGLQAAAGSTAAVEVTVKNYGTNTLTAMDVMYTIDGGSPVTQSWTGSLTPSSTTTVTMPGFTVPTGSYTMCAYTSLTSDGDYNNDTLCRNLYGATVVSIPYTDNFDSGTALWYDSSAAGTIWELGTPNYGVTNSAYSSPNSWDVNLNSGYGNDAESKLTSPIFDFTNISNASLSFYQNRSIEDWSGDGCFLEYTTDGGVTWKTLGAVNDVNGVNWYNNTIWGVSDAWDYNSNGWIKSSYNLNAFSGEPSLQFRFKFISGAFNWGAWSGMSIDDFSIIEPPEIDAGVDTVILPSFINAAGTSSSVQVIIKNYGSDTLYSLTVHYTVNGGLPVSTPWSGTLAPNTTATVSLGSFTIPTGQYTLCAYTEVAGDGDLSNDTACKSCSGLLLYTVPWSDDFEGADFWGVGDGLIQWERGTPSSSIIDSAYSPTTAWKINLNGAYQDGSNDNLYSPFFDFSGTVDAEIRFYHWLVTETGYDGGRVDYSTNGGVSWQILGTGGYLNSVNWYNSSNLWSSYQPAWDGVSPGYVLSTYKLSFLNNFPSPVQFRFNFSSTASWIGTPPQDGWAIDNFEIFVPVTRSVATYSASPGLPLLLPVSQTMNAVIKNKGTTALSSVDVTLEIDGNIIVTDSKTFTPALTKNAIASHTFSQPWLATPGAHTIRVWTSNPNGQVDLDTGDDTLIIQLTVFDSTSNFPYCNDFDSSQPEWVTLNALSYDGDNIWEIGAPNKITMVGAHSGNNAWVTKLSTNYENKDSSGLFTPMFNVDSVNCYKLSFWHKYSTEEYQDGGTVEYSTDGGASWKVLGFAWEPNWMNSPYITALGGVPVSSGWSGISNNWEYSEHNIKFPANTSVVIRFRFGSDYTVNDEGWAIDDVCFEKLPPCVVGVEGLTAEGFSLDQNYPNPSQDYTKIVYTLSESGDIKLTITNTLGQVIKYIELNNQPEGSHIIHLDLKDWSEGIYYYNLSFGSKEIIKKMTIIR